MLNQKEIATARDKFLSDGIESPDVRRATIRAWRRSRIMGANPHAIPSPVMSETRVDPSSMLLQAVTPVASKVVEQLTGADAAIMVTDKDARIVGRWIAGSSMKRRLDNMSVLTGAVFEEATVGSTGLGTVLEEGTTTVIEGAEHFNSAFDGVTAVGVPIIHPGTGTIEGVVDLVSPTGVPAEMMVALIKRAAKEMGEHLLSGYAAEDRALLDAFLRSERRGVRRPVLAVNRRLRMANPLAVDLPGLPPHAFLWERVERACGEGREFVELSDTSEIEYGARVRPVRDGNLLLGCVLQISAEKGPARNARRSNPAASSTILADEIMTRLPGASRVIGREHLPSAIERRQPPRGLTYLERVERDAILALLEAAGGNKKQVAETLGLSRATVYRKLASLGLDYV